MQTFSVSGFWPTKIHFQDSVHHTEQVKRVTLWDSVFCAVCSNVVCILSKHNICALCTVTYCRKSRMVVCFSEHAQTYTWPTVGGQGLTGERVVFICWWKSRRLEDRLHMETPLHGFQPCHFVFFYISLAINLRLSFPNSHLALSSHSLCTQVSIQIHTSDCIYSCATKGINILTVCTFSDDRHLKLQTEATLTVDVSVLCFLLNS